jgi:predicted transcriptional regulator of viral defense system
MEKLRGLGKKDRERLSAVLRDSKGTISVAEAAGILKTSNSSAAKMLALWAKKGWLARFKRGLYIPVPLDSRTASIPLEDPWLIAERLYSPCYIGGWSAAGYWELSEQIFRRIVVMTTRRPRIRRPTVKGTDFFVRTVSNKSLFGLKTVWRGQVKINVSDPSRTIVDMLCDPQLGGGIRTVIDIFRNYLSSKNKDLELLISYADRLGNGAVFKRLGFVLELVSPEDKTALLECRKRLTTGNAKLDPTMPANSLITRWRIWVSEKWAKEVRIDHQK